MRYVCRYCRERRAQDGSIGLRRWEVSVVGGLIEIGGIEVNAIDALLYIWFALAGVSTAYVAWDNFVKKNPEETVMKWGWVLITLYMGPVALALYVLSDKEPEPGTHEEFIRPLWKQGVGSYEHEGSGNVPGNDLFNDGSGHGGDGAARAALLGRDVSGRYRRLRHR